MELPLLNLFDWTFGQPPSWRDAVDILLVTVVVYYLLLLIRGTRAVQTVLGILFLLASLYLARYFQLTALKATLERFFAFLPFAIIVLFQQEIRRALANFGRGTLMRGLGQSHNEADVFNDVALAATSLAEKKVGALIVFERLEGLRDYVETGIQLDALVSLDLLVNLFAPGTPTHDGAVIIQGERIAAATCFLPLTQDRGLSKEFGTRHRAALGITEETDAVAVVVSEETGVISLAFGGKMRRDLESKDLRNLLFKTMITDVHEGRA